MKLRTDRKFQEILWLVSGSVFDAVWSPERAQFARAARGTPEPTATWTFQAPYESSRKML